MTPFEQAVEAVKNGELSTPSVSYGANPVPYFRYQLATSKFALSLMKSGMSVRGTKLSDIKRYYGLKGRTAADVYPQFIELMENFLNESELTN